MVYFTFETTFVYCTRTFREPFSRDELHEVDELSVFDLHPAPNNVRTSHVSVTLLLLNMVSMLPTRQSFALLIVTLFLLAQTSNALYFYLEGSEKKCFLEELPKETMVTGICPKDLGSSRATGLMAGDY